MQVFFKKVLGSLIVLASVFVIMFGISHYAPGDPAKMVLGQRSNQSTYQVVRQGMGLDKSFTYRVKAYFTEILKGDWGRSYISHRKVRDIIGEAVPVTLKLCAFSMAIALLVGSLFGAGAAYKEGTLAGRIINLTTVAGFSLPHFWLALMLQVFFGIFLKVLPISGIGKGQLYYYLLPGLSIGLPLGFAYARLIGAGLMETLAKPFFLAARSWGFSEKFLLTHHVFPNIVYLIIVQVATDAAFLLGGAVIAERIFALPGLGSVLVNAVVGRDWPVVHGVIIITAVIIAGLNLTVRLAGPLIDPRIYNNSQLKEGNRI